MKSAFYITILSIILYGCSTSKAYMPSTSQVSTELTNLPSSNVSIKVSDIRGDKGDSENLKSLLKSEIENSLGKNNSATLSQNYILEIDIVEYRSYFSLAVWNGSAKLRARLLSSDNSIVGTFEGVGASQRSNTMGNATAKRVAQDAYNSAVADLLSNLKSAKVN